MVDKLNWCFYAYVVFHHWSWCLILPIVSCRQVHTCKQSRPKHGSVLLSFSPAQWCSHTHPCCYLSFCPLFILYLCEKGAGSQQALKSGLGTMRHWDVLVFTANGFSLFIKTEAGSACSNTLPTPQCGCYFLIVAAWNFCSCLQKPPRLFMRSDWWANIASLLCLWLAFSIPPLLGRPSELPWQRVYSFDYVHVHL